MRARRHALDLAVLFVVATAAAAAVFVAQPGLHAAVVRGYVLVVGALAMTVVVSAAADRLPGGRRSELALALAPRAGDDASARPAQLARVEREVVLAVATAQDLHTKLLPQLREIAGSRLARRGLRPSPETLGPWWELLRPDRPPPDDRFAPGIRQADLRALVDELERM